MAVLRLTVDLLKDGLHTVLEYRGTSLIRNRPPPIGPP